MQKQVQLDGFQNVVANGVAVCDLAKFIGSVIEKFTFTLGGTSFTKSMISLIQIKANSKVIWESTGANLEASNAYMGIASDVTKLKLDFMDRLAVTVNARQAGAIDLSQGSGISQLRMEVTIAGATAPTLVGFADVSPPAQDAQTLKDEMGIRGLIARRHRMTYVAGAAGEFAIPIPHMDPVGGGSCFRRIWIFTANGTKIRTVREGIQEHELLKLENEHAQKDNKRVPQANLIVFDPCQDGQLKDRVWDTRPAVGVRSAAFYLTVSAGETITVETDELIGLGSY